MKSKITTLILSLITSISFGQITFVKEITGYRLNFPPFHYIDSKLNFIESGKYIIAQNHNSELEYEIWDRDYNLYKKINIDLTLNSNGGFLKMDGDPIICDHLFNTDDKIEYIYTVYESEYEWSSAVSRTIIADEDNNILMSFENVYLDIDNFFVFNGKTYFSIQQGNSTKIYEVAGNLPCMQCNSKTSNTNTTKSPAPNYAFKIFPNPTDGQLNIESDLDELNMQIKIYSTLGQLLQTDPFFYGTNSVNVSSLASGTYVINIVSDKGFLHTEKFVKR